MLDLIAEIKNRIDIETLLRTMGITKNTAGFVSSPGKAENTASAKLYPPHHYVDFSSTGAAKKRDLIDYYSEYYNVDTKTAIKEICGLCGINETSNTDSVRITPESRRETHSPVSCAIEDIIDCLSEDEKYIYYEFLGKFEDEAGALIEVKKYRIKNNSKIFTEMFNYCKNYRNNKAWDYLTKKRMIPEQYLNYFRIFTIENYSQVNNHLKKVFALEELQRSGLFNEKGNLVFFNHRIIIPYIFRNEIVYLRGRFFDDNGPNTDEFKYLGVKSDKLGVNTPKRLYNIDIIKSMLPDERLFITEGEFDTIVYHIMGFNAVCIPGAGNIPSINVLKQLLPFQIIYGGDVDQAGVRLLTGHYQDNHGNLKFTENNLTTIYEKMGKKIFVQKLKSKDINDHLIKCAAGANV